MATWSCVGNYLADKMAGRFVPLGEIQEDENEIHNVSNQEKVSVLVCVFIIIIQLYQRL